MIFCCTIRVRNEEIVHETRLEFQNDFEPCVAASKGIEEIFNFGSVYEIHFQFQPNLKKLLISMVRLSRKVRLLWIFLP